MKLCTCKHHVGNRECPDIDFKCNITKSTPLGTRNACRACVSFQRRMDREKHDTHIKQKLAEWRASNKDYVSQYGKAYRNNPSGRAVRQKSYEKNRNQKREYDRNRWQTDINVRARHMAVCARRRLLLHSAIPPWFEVDAVRDLYVECARLSQTTGIEHQVDHIIPVQNDLVCGLHCLANLQIITAAENQSKGNKFTS